MPLLFRFLARTRWCNTAAGILLLLLQRTPVVRALLVAESALTAPTGSVLRSLLPVAALGMVQTLVGASTQLVGSVAQPARATVGQPFVEGVVIQGAGVTYAQSWTISNTLPPGINAVGATLQNGRFVINPSGGTLVFSGTPTTPGTYSISISGYQFTNFTGPVTNATAQIIVAAAPNAAPTISRQPANTTSVTGGTATLSVGFTGTPAPTFQWAKDGVAIAGATNATLVLASVTAANAGTYTVTLTNSLGAVTSSSATLVVNPAPVAPTFAAVPAAQAVTAGADVALSVTVTGVPTPALQWLKDGVPIEGATAATLLLTSAQVFDAGAYSVLARNSAGTATSAAATVVVRPAASAPVFVSPPVAQTVSAGGTVVFSAPVLAFPEPTLQWQRDGANLPGATGATLLLTDLAPANTGQFTCIATNALGTTASPAAALTVSTTPNIGRLSNLSILTEISAASPNFSVGTVISGGGTKPLLLRAVGPALVEFGLSGGLTDPKLDLLAGQNVLASDDDWGGTVLLKNVFTQVGAFALPDATSKDAAIYSPALVSRDYTVQVSGVGGATGTVIAELYDVTPAAVFTAATPRLINVSVLKQIAAGSSLTAGFVIGGETAKTVLIRAIGPGLTALGVGGVLADPQLKLFNGDAIAIASNNDWAGDAAIAAAAARSGAFKIADPASKDAMLLLTLAPGNYSATASGAGGTGGFAIVEIYEVQ